MAPPPDLSHLLEQDIYPEQTEGESAVLRDWIRAHGAEYDEIKVSVRLGAGADVDENLPENYRRMAGYVTRHRADAVARVGDSVTVVEAKIKVTSSVLGQLRTYRRLYLEDHPNVSDVNMLAVGRYGNLTTIRVLQAEGVDVALYQTAEQI